ncbi:MAG TPA: FliM/FliN family flagellar motor switch protein [Acidobacteriaceae bacterium]|nr:FliM/FliN family flagellar motor switch protein [Acidobacteriaceae bacterium]
MAGNRRVLDLWFEIMRAELEQIGHVPVTARAAEEIPLASSFYRTQLGFEGPVHGTMYAAASASGLVQLSQMVAGEPLDAHAAWTEEGLEVWHSWLSAASGKLAARLAEEFAEGSQDACTILLRDTMAVDGAHLASGTDTSASGSAIQKWMLQAGEIEFVLSVSVQVMFPIEEAPAVGVDQPEPEIASPEPIETAPQGSPSRDLKTEIPLAEASALREDRHAAPPGEIHPLVDPPPASRQAQEPSAQDANAYTEPPTKRRLDLLLDIELEATLRFGALELPLREVLELGPGDVLPLDRHVREPVELVVGDRIVAKGEVVLVSGNFALHVTEVAEPRRRLETIRCLF